MNTEKVFQVVGFRELVFLEMEYVFEFINEMMIRGGDGEVIHVNTEYYLAAVW